MTSDPPHQVAGSLSLLKPFVHEINVAVDSRVNEQLLGPLIEISDQFWRFDFRPPVDRARAWLASQCTSDWIFWMDGDEIPSPDLVRSLKKLSVSNDVLQFVFMRRWLYPDYQNWIEESPWWPDLQRRLVRNDPATMWFGATTHEPIGSMSPFRVVEAPLYHLAALALPEVRQKKIMNYDAETPGMISPAGGPFNEVLLTPERYVRKTPLPVPLGDRAAIFSVLQPRAATLPLPFRIPPLVAAETIDSLSPTRTLNEVDYRAGISCIEADRRFAPGVARDLLIRISNDGHTWWPPGENRSPCINLSYHLLDQDKSVRVYDGKRTCLPCGVSPGDSVLVPACVEPPAEPGRYLVIFDLVHEHVRWFGTEALVTIEVTPQHVHSNCQ